jgi:hypothetical protein
MIPEGYIEYKRREFCKDIRCPLQLDLETKAEGSPEYESIRAVCQKQCRCTTYQFHHWLMAKGYLIIKPAR